MSSLTLPGLCSPDTLKTRLNGLPVTAAFVTVSRHLFDVAQAIQMDGQGGLDPAKRADPRFGPAILLSCAMQLGVTDDARRRAWRRISDLNHVLKTHGGSGCAGLVAQAALALARAVQVLDRDVLASVVDQLDQAATARAAELKVNPTAFTAGLQMSLLRHLNA